MTNMSDPNVLTSHGVTVAFAHPTPASGRWACEDQDPELFFPKDNSALAEALAICSGCPMREICLDLGETRSESGVWGGALLSDGRHLERVPMRGRPRKATAA